MPCLYSLFEDANLTFILEPSDEFDILRLNPITSYGMQVTKNKQA